MKIYFEDDQLCLVNSPNGAKIVDAQYGYYDNYRRLELFNKTSNNDTIIYTNSLVALNNDYCWNEDKKCCELYLRNIAGEWKPCQSLTDKEIRKAHNLEKIYRAGSFAVKLKDNWNI